MHQRQIQFELSNIEELYRTNFKINYDSEIGFKSPQLDFVGSGEGRAWEQGRVVFAFCHLLLYVQRSNYINNISWIGLFLRITLYGVQIILVSRAHDPPSIETFVQEAIF